MLPAPGNLLEAELWSAHLRLQRAQADGRGVGAADDEAKALLASYLGGGPQHAQAVRDFLRRVDEEAAFREREKAAAIALCEQAEADRARFRAHVLNAMRACNLERLRAGGGLLYVGRARSRVEAPDPSRVPDEFVRIVPARRELREREARQAMADGAHVPGVLLVEGDVQLVVR